MGIPHYTIDLPGVLEAIAILLTSVLVIWGFWLGLYRPTKRHFDRVNAGMDTLLGYPAVNDPGSGREIQPATPPLAMRVYDLEQSNMKMANALGQLADNQRLMLELKADMDERRRMGDAIIADFSEWRAAVNKHLTEWASEQDELSHLIREQIPPMPPAPLPEQDKT